MKHWYRRWCVGLALVVLPVDHLQSQARPASPSAVTVDLSYGVRIPMPDGVVLSATIYRPKAQATPLPVILLITPYIADLSHRFGMYYAEHGYVAAVVDSRGRGNSGGHFEPMAAEHRDGPWVVRWLARQPWSNGKVGLWGGSYGGFAQWAVLKGRPTEVVTAVPVASAYPGVDFPHLRNIQRSYSMQWLTFTSGAAGQTNLFSDRAFWMSKYAERFRDHRRFAALDTIAGNLTTHFQTWVQHPTEDSYWRAMVPTHDEYAQINVPILTITGYFDGDQTGALTYYRRHLAAAPPDAQQRHYLILGPWDHAGTRTPKKTMGGLEFGPASLLDMDRLQREWYDWTMKDGPRPSFLRKRVAYWVMSETGTDGEWKYADDIDAISDSTLTLYLDAGSGAGDVLHSGRLASAPPPAGHAAGQWTYDPLEVHSLSRQIAPPPADYYKTQAAAYGLAGNGLVYHTGPFSEPTEISGSPTLTAYISMDVPDSDFEVTLYEILPDGTAIYLTDDVLRARYRRSRTEPVPVVPGEVTKYRFEQFTFFSRRIGAGSRLRLVIQSQNSIAWEKNYNSGGVVSQETAADARTARIQLLGDSRYPSALALPIVRSRAPM